MAKPPTCYNSVGHRVAKPPMFDGRSVAKTTVEDKKPAIFTGPRPFEFNEGLGEIAAGKAAMRVFLHGTFRNRGQVTDRIRIGKFQENDSKRPRKARAAATPTFAFGRFWAASGRRASQRVSFRRPAG